MKIGRFLLQAGMVTAGVLSVAIHSLGAAGLAIAPSFNRAKPPPIVVDIVPPKPMPTKDGKLSVKDAAAGVPAALDKKDQYKKAVAAAHQPEPETPKPRAPEELVRSPKPSLLEESSVSMAVSDVDPSVHLGDRPIVASIGHFGRGGSFGGIGGVEGGTGIGGGGGLGTDTSGFAGLPKPSSSSLASSSNFADLAMASQILSQLGQGSPVTNGGGAGGGGGGASPVGDPGAKPPTDGRNGDQQCVPCGSGCAFTSSDAQNCGSCGNACASGQQCILGFCTGGNNQQYIVDSIALPVTTLEYATDLDGNGTLDNQFAVFLSVLRQFGINLQNNINNLTWGGSTVLLFDVPPIERPKDPVTLYQGVPTGQPDFSGSGHYTVDSKQQVASFPDGKRTKTTYAYLAPRLKEPPVLKMYVKSPDGLASFTLPLVSHRLLVEIYENNGKPIMMTGTLQGSLRKSDLEKGFVAEVARYMENVLQQPPGKIQPGVQTVIRNMFDTGGPNGYCKGSDGVIGLPEDGKIAPCEILENYGMKKAFVPDIQVYDDQGAYNPTPTPAKLDSLSFGLQFWGTPATFSP